MSKLHQIRANCAGADVGSAKIFIGIQEQPVKQFDTYTGSLQQAVNYVKEQGITEFAMEATGIYWISFYDMLTAAGIKVHVVNGRHVKHVPGCKSDTADCMWIQQVHSYGLLRNSFIPDDNIRQLRTYMRIRQDAIELQVTHVHHMQKALTQMNIRLTEAISEVHGVSGLKMIQAILQGERDPEKLVALCDPQIIKRKKETVMEALNGFYKQEHLFELYMAYKGYSFYQQQIAHCDKQINKWLQKNLAGKQIQEVKNRSKKIRHHAPAVKELHQKMVQLYDGKDVTCVPGITQYTWLQLTAETGMDLSAWPTVKHFTSWLGLSPAKHESGKRKKYKSSKSCPKAGQLLKEASLSVLNSKTHALGAFGRKIRSRKGPSVAIKALARKIAVMYYFVLTKGIAYVEQGIQAYEKHYLEVQQKLLEKRAKQLNLQLVPIEN
jgi:transposase